ncbi:MAG: SWIM zinc finger family protein [Bifidobacteriaceae bacterium]|jgi:uncharacterized Zn finger protein|nr:SWIM zinc finger family protein [Bifidobacteriaceae bacterium]
MSWGYRYRYYGKPSVANQKANAEKQLSKLRKTYPEIEPVSIEGNKIAKTWWGISWCKNLERYADYENRIERGRSYVKNGLVLDLKITAGTVIAMVSGSDVYDVAVKINQLPGKKWEEITSHCAERIDSIAQLVDGEFPEELADVFMQQGSGLFPAPREIHLYCSCPDVARMCKHVAAVLYGVGARLDTDPLLFFTLRRINPTALIKKSVDEKMKSLLANANKRSKRVIREKDVERIFGLSG